MKKVLLSMLACASLGMAKENFGTCRVVFYMDGLDKSGKTPKKVVAISSLSFEKRWEGHCDAYENGIYVKALRKIKLANDVPFDPVCLQHWGAFYPNTGNAADERYDNLILDFKSKDYTVYKHFFSYSPED